MVLYMVRWLVRQRNWKELEEQLTLTKDGTAKIKGCIEAAEALVVKNGDSDGAKRLMEMALKVKGKVNGSTQRVWLKYTEILKLAYSQTIQHDEKQVKAIRGLFRRAIEYSKDGQQFLINEWVAFENLYGDKESLDKARSFLVKKKVGGDLYSPLSITAAGSGAKEPDEDAEKVTLFLSNIPAELTQEELVEQLQQLDPSSTVLSCRLPRTKTGDKKGVAYVDLQSEKQARTLISLLPDSAFNYVAELSQPPKENP